MKIFSLVLLTFTSHAKTNSRESFEASLVSAVQAMDVEKLAKLFLKKSSRGVCGSGFDQTSSRGAAEFVYAHITPYKERLSEIVAKGAGKDNDYTLFLMPYKDASYVYKFELERAKGKWAVRSVSECDAGDASFYYPKFDQAFGKK
jgi:hypothetical protein